MAKTDTVTIKMISTGKSYKVEKTKYDRLEEVFMYAKENMTSPCMFHLLSHIHEPEVFRITKKDLIKSFERALKRQYKPLNQLCPDTVIAYSIEYKDTTQKEINGDSDAYKVGNSVWQKTDNKLPFLHIHFYVIADCRKTIPQSFPKHATAALNELQGLRAARYFKSIDGDIYKRLNDDCDDAFSRFLYIGKVEQKSPEIPYRNTSSSSQIN